MVVILGNVYGSQFAGEAVLRIRIRIRIHRIHMFLGLGSGFFYY